MNREHTNPKHSTSSVLEVRQVLQSSLIQEVVLLKCQRHHSSKQQIYLAFSDCLYLLQGRLTPMPIEQGRKILSQKGQRFFELEKSGHPQLPVFSKLSQKNVKAPKVCHVQYKRSFPSLSALSAIPLEGTRTFSPPFHRNVLPNMQSKPASSTSI